MDRFSKFRRSKKDSVGATGVVVDDKTATPQSVAASASRTPSPAGAGAGSATVAQHVIFAAPGERRRDRHSPFRGLHLRTTTKRARSSPPAALPQSPTSASTHHSPFHHSEAVGSDHRHHGSPLSAIQHIAQAATRSGQNEGLKPRESLSQPRSGQRETAFGAGGPKIPSFLTLSPQEIESKFQDLMWLERDRIAQSIQNTAPTFQFARVPSQPHVKRLDRYVNVQPWQNNRVRLQVPPGKPDYINASPISLSTTKGGSSGHNGGVEEHPSRYIAMQGPKKNSVEHVWRMVVEQLRSPAVIVMLTETHEGLAEKCYPYFPRSPDSPPIEVGASDEFSDGFRATIRCEAIEPTCAGDAIELRKLVIRVHQQARTTPASSTARRPRQQLNNGEGESHNREFDVDGGSPTLATQDEDEDAMIMSPFKADASAGRGMFPSLRSRRDRSQNGQRSSRSSSRTSARTGGDRTPAESTDREDSGIAEENEEEHEAEERVVHHFLYKKWPDFGVPALEDLDSFFTLMRLSREKNADPENPRIVHCSAGVGRSGTFIALEHLMRELDSGVLENYDEGGRGARSRGGDTSVQKQSQEEEEDDDDGDDDGVNDEDDLIFNTVNQLREQRRNMVQAEGQFLFIYQVLRKLWQDKYGVPEDEQEPAAKRLEVDPFLGL